MPSATALAHPNIALIKYWGKRPGPLNLPAVPSLSLTLAPFRTQTRVDWGIDEEVDQIELNGEPARGAEGGKVSAFLDRLGGPGRPRCRVQSANNFPTAAGLASSASGFAALALAASAAAGRTLEPGPLSALARQGSGSASRSIFGGWALWRRGEREDGLDSAAEQVAPPEHWEVEVVVALISSGRKELGSTEAMARSARTSPLYPGWVEAAPALVEEARLAVLHRDLPRLGELMEHSTMAMFGTMLSARPPIRYWKPQSLVAQEVVLDLRRQGLQAWATSDAGPNVKVFCPSAEAPQVEAALQGEGIATVRLRPGPGAALVEL